MASLVVTRRLASLRILSHSPSSRHHDVSISNPIFHFSTQIQQKEDVPFIAQYLISAFGFSEDRALRVASDKILAGIKNPDQPESVIRLFKDIGLADIQIKNVITWAPQLLSRRVTETLEPRIRAVIADGFSKKTLIQLIRSNPIAINQKDLLLRLQFWRNFVGNNEEALSKLLGKFVIVNLDIDKKVIPQINLLRRYGLSDRQIVKMLMRMDYLLVREPDFIKLLFERIEKLGFDRGSDMFVEGLIIVGSLKKETLDKKAAFFKITYGWSEEDMNLAIRKFPGILNYSEEKVRSAMDFLIRKVGLDPRSIALLPILLGCSLEKRLIPRHYVLTMLKSKSKRVRNFRSVCLMSEKLFVEKFILPYKEELPDLEEGYFAARVGKLPLS